MGSTTLREAASAVLNKKAFDTSKGDKPEKLEGEVQDLGPAVVEPDAKSGPDAAAKMPEGKDKKIKGKAKPGDKAAQKLKAAVKMQEDEELEDEDILDEEEEIVEDEETAFLDEDGESFYEEEEDIVSEDEEVTYSLALPSLDEMEIDVEDDVKAMFEGQDLSEEFIDKATLIFESAVRSNVDQYRDTLVSMFEENLMVAAEAIKEDVENNVDKYLNYVVEDWVEQNEVAIDSGLRTELAEDVLKDIREAFVKNYIDIPEDKVDVVEALSVQVQELEGDLNEALEDCVNLSQLVKENEKEKINMELTEGLTETQAEKILTLAEGVEFDDEDQYTDNLNTLIESYFPKASGKRPAQLDEDIINDPESNLVREETPLRGDMDKYVAAIGKLVK